MLLYNKAEQIRQRKLRGKELIRFCGGSTHMAEMLGPPITRSMVEGWRLRGIPRSRCGDIVKHPTIAATGKFTRVYLLALDKVATTK